jgi:hypothetical protein
VSWSVARLALAVALAGSALPLAPGAARADGTLGVYFDAEGRTCSGDVSAGGMTTLHVVLLPGGATFGGITGAEFRIQLPAGSGFVFGNPTFPSAAVLRLGDALGDGINVGFAECRSGPSITLMSFSAIAAGTPGRDVIVRVIPRRTPTNPEFTCPVATQCDAPYYTAVCVEGSFAVLNAGSTAACGSNRVSSQWGLVKELYRP